MHNRSLSKQKCMEIKQYTQRFMYPGGSRSFTDVGELYGTFAFPAGHPASGFMSNVENQCHSWTFLLTLTPYFLFLVLIQSCSFFPKCLSLKNLLPPYSHCHCLGSMTHHLSPEHGSLWLLPSDQIHMR